MSSAAGIMLASTFFSLLMPALETGVEYSYLVLTGGFLLGGILIILTDIVTGKLNFFTGNAKKKSCAVMCIAVTIHNIPEGMAIGVAFGALAAGNGMGAVAAITFASGLLPWALSFSAGAMIAVVCSELIPESFSGSKVKATAGVIFGFALMMILDVAFG